MFIIIYETFAGLVPKKCSKFKSAWTRKQSHVPAAEGLAQISEAPV
jgi:hypothetical protein